MEHKSVFGRWAPEDEAAAQFLVDTPILGRRNQSPEDENSQENPTEDEEDECFVFVEKDVHRGAFPIMEDIRRSGKLCDVTIKVS